MSYQLCKDLTLTNGHGGTQGPKAAVSLAVCSRARPSAEGHCAPGRVPGGQGRSTETGRRGERTGKGTSAAGRDCGRDGASSSVYLAGLCWPLLCASLVLGTGGHT